jgi:phosphoribosylamine--glycine ligase
MTNEDKTRVLVIGGGGREHALAWRIARGAGDTPLDDRAVVVAPGNGGIHRELPCNPLSDLDGWAELAKGFDLVVVGPEQPLVDGLVERVDTPVVGPSAAAAQLEGSKVFMKELAREAGVETARFGVFTSMDEAGAFLDGFSGDEKVVVKADGLCAGKGVAICESPSDARDEVARYLDGRFGDASRTVVIEAFLEGVEISILALTDGERCLYFPPARDHKRLLDDDQGPNTGGMGAVCPLGEAEGISRALLEEIDRDVFQPSLKALRDRGTPFRGILYGGLMLTQEGPSLLEFNVRFGDPEAQAVLFGLEADLLPSLLEVGRGEPLSAGPWDLLGKCKKSACVVLASEGYPSSPVKGKRIPEATPGPSQAVFFAGAREEAERGGPLLTSGGRVLAACAKGETFAEALDGAYALADQLRFEGAQLRRDIGASVR